jgi:AcrR family transcriptional regulator
MAAPVVTRGPGRPRSEAIDAAILDATIAELVDRGYLALSVEGIAVRAGVAKTTIYRRWPNVHELAIAALLTFEQDANLPVPDRCVRDQLVWLLNGMRRKWSDPRYAAIMRRVVADGTSQPEVYRQSRDRLVGPHLRTMNGVLARGVAEGLLRPGIDLDWTRQLLTSPIMAATLTLKDRITTAQVEFVVDTVLSGLAPLAG